MFKRILKIVGICFAIFIVLCGAGVGIYALQGGFKNTKINIIKLYMDDTQKADKTIYTLNDFTTQINCEPLNATSKELEVIIQDPMRIEEDGKLVQEGILKNVPNVVTAGEDFKIEINKDANGNNYGGAVTLTFRPKGDDKSIAIFKLKVIVDVVIPNNSLYFSGNNSDEYSTIYGKTITMGRGNSEKYVYLKSNLVNAFYLEANLEEGKKNLKSAEISYTYVTLDGKRSYDMNKGDFVDIKSGQSAVINTFTNLNYNRVYNEVDNEYNYYFEVPVTPKESGVITMTAKMHKTYEIQQDYIAGDFDNMIEPSVNNPNGQLQLDKFNEFINKYISYFDTSDESYEFFKNYMKADGTINLNYKAVNNAKEFIFQTTKSTINITAVNLDSITSTDVPEEFDVFSELTYNTKQISDKFSLKIGLSEENVAQEENETANLLDTLEVSPYIYLEKSEYLNNRDTLWQNYGIVLPVTDFTNKGKPVVLEMDDDDYSSEKLEGIDCIGYLIALSNKNSYKEYMTVSKNNQASNKQWTLNFDVPLPQNNVETSVKTATKALFLQFQVTGMDLNTSEKIVKNDYTRIYINYEEYKYNDQENAKISFSSTPKRMSINTNVQNANNYNYASELNTQTIKVSLEDSISNYNSVQYKRIMYFVEQKSNKLENGGGNKLATVGSYKFRYMNDGAIGSSSTIKRFDTEEDLIGERLICDWYTNKDPEYKLYALNASLEPARIFAVVYLSDKDGNPIDINGRPITINESIVGGEETTLVVFAISDITQNGMTSVTIDNFVSNLNYYTVSKIGYSINEDVDTDGDGNTDTTISYTVAENDWVKRNKIDGYVDSETGLSFSNEKLEELQNFLKVKMLYKNKITLYATNFELTNEGTLSDVDTANATLTMDIRDFYGNIIKDKAYDINTYQNKQLALNNMANSISDYYLNVLVTSGNPVSSTKILYSDPADTSSAILGIIFEIIAEEKSNSTDDYIYIKARDGVANSLDYNRKDYVSWEVNKLNVEDIVLYDVESENNKSELNTYNKLYSKYKKDSEQSGTQIFGTVKKDQDYSFKSYTLYEYVNSDNEGYTKGSIDDNIYFVVKNNLYEDDAINLNLVDMSQAIYQGSDIETNPTNGVFGCLYDYIEYYTKNNNNTKITYQNASGVAQLKNDLYFPSDKVSGGNYILVGSKKYLKKYGTVSIDGVTHTNVNYITAGGRNYLIETSTDKDNYNGEDVVIIKKGEYFPIIKNYTVNGNSVVIICDEEFIINKDTGSGIIYNIADQSTGRRKPVIISETTIINGQTYKVSDYIDDGINDNTSTSLEKTYKDTTNNKVTSATVKFIKGGTLKDDSGSEIYVEDANGKYYLDNGEYKICPETDSNAVRYSKKGIIAYMMVTYNFIQLNGESGKPITKVIAYELIQEPITLVATGKVYGNDDVEGGIQLKEEGVDSESIKVYAGRQYEFSLENVSSADAKSEENTISIVGASYEKDFFYNCTFTIEGGKDSSSGISFRKDNQDKYEIKISTLNEGIVINIPNKYSDSTAKIIISYTDESGKKIEKCLRLYIVANYKFETKSDKVNTSNNQYIISLDSDSTYSITSDIIANYFEIGDNVNANTVTLEMEVYNDNNHRTSDYAKIDGDNLIIGTSYAYLDDSYNIIRDYAIFKLYLVDGTNKIEITNTLYIQITPKYTIDLNNITGNIIYGTNVFTSDYISIYNGASKRSEDKITGTTFSSVVQEIGLELYQSNQHLENGIIALENIHTSSTDVEFIVKYKEGLANVFTESHKKHINVVGFEGYYSAQGNFAGDDESYEHIKNIAGASISELSKAPDTSTIIWNRSADLEINLQDYFRVFTINTHTVIYPVLKFGENKYQVIEGNTSGSYTLCYATLDSVNGQINILAETNITVSINLVKLFYSTSGFNGEDFSTLSGNNSYKLDRNFEVTTSEDSVQIEKYLRAFVNTAENKDVLVLKDGESIVNSPITTTTDSKTYKICYKLNNNKEIETNYTITIRKN